MHKEDHTCGPVTLFNVLVASGRTEHDEPELARLCQAKPDTGTTNADMVKAAKDLGLEILETGSEADIGQLEARLGKSAHVIVCYISLSGGGHYSIIQEYDDKAFCLLDCSCGLIRTEKPAFLKRRRNRREAAERWFMAIA